MRSLAVLAALAVLVTAMPLQAAEIEYLNMPLPAPYASRTAPEELTAEQRDGEVAGLRATLARRLDQPLRQKKLMADILRTEAQIHALDRIIAEYEHISRPLYSNPFLYTLENMKLARLDAALRLEQLRFEKQALDENFHALRRLDRLRR